MALYELCREPRMQQSRSLQPTHGLMKAAVHLTAVRDDSFEFIKPFEAAEKAATLRAGDGAEHRLYGSWDNLRKLA